MQRRDFLKSASWATLATTVGMSGNRRSWADDPASCCDRTYASPTAAMQSERERLLYVPAIYVGTQTQKPDYLRQYDVSDPASPRLVGRVWLGGVIGHKPDTNRPLTGGPQMLQLSLDGRRLYVTNSLYSPWDNQFYPEMAQRGSYLMEIDCDTEQGGMTVNEDFFVDFGLEPSGPARAHEMRFPGGDCTSDIWV